MKKKQLITGIFLFLVMTIYLISGTDATRRSAEDYEQIIGAARQTGARPVLIQFHQSQALPSVEHAEAIFSMGDKWKRTLSREWNTPVAEDRDLTEKHPHYQIVWQKGEAKFTVKWTATFESGRWTPFLITRIEAPIEQLDQAIMWKEQWSKWLQKQRVLVKFNTCLESVYDAKLNHDQQNDRITQVLHSLEARVVEQMEDHVVISTSAYSPHISDYILTNDMKMNVQAATHVDHEKSLTRLIIGTPIITTTY